MTLADLERLIDAGADGRGVATGVPRQHLTREASAPRDVDVAYRPMLCFVVSGAKTTAAGPSTGRVSRGAMFLSRFDLPVLAAYEPPYRSVTLDIDAGLLAAVVAEGVPSPVGADEDVIMSAPMDDGLVSALTRWVALAQEPGLVDALAPRLEQEILIRVLGGPLGVGLRQSIAAGPAAAIRELTALLTRSPELPLTVADLADRAAMSPATLFRHFRAATGLSPGQFQKLTRLQKARRLLATGTHPVSAAALAVGYVSVQQFSRDYRRRYGVPPGRDARALREGGAGSRR